MIRQSFAEASEYVAELGPLGGTNVHGGLKEAFADPEVDTIFFLSDGEPSMGDVVERKSGDSLQTVPGSRLVGVMRRTPGLAKDFAQRHGRFTGTPAQQAEQHEALRAAHWVVSPLARPPRIEPERVLVLEGDSDLVTGRQHAERLAAHFSAQIVRFPGGHLLHFGRGRAFQAIHELLQRQGLTRA